MNMKYINLGNTDISVSRICIGGMSFGQIVEGGHQWLLDAKDTEEMLDHAFGLGVNFIDTANTYEKGTGIYWQGDEKAWHSER